MESHAQAAALAGCRRVLRPMISFLLRIGLGYREFVDLVKEVFVEVSSEEYGLRGRPTNVSRVAVMTGLTRKEVKRVREHLESRIEEKPVKRSPANQVLNYWHTDSQFLTESNRPADLWFDEREPSFVTLVRKYGGDVPPVALMKELKRGNAIAQLENGQLRAVARFFEPTELDAQFITVVTTALAALADTVNRNSKTPAAPDKYLQRTVATDHLEPRFFHDFRSLCEDRAQDILDYLDRWLNNHEIQPDRIKDLEKTRKNTVGLGIYFFSIGAED